jgi:hypothetical protein
MGGGLAYCAPVLVPYLLGDGDSVRRGVASVGGFLGGRLVGYLTFAVLAWLTHFAILDHLPYQRLLIGIATMGLALLLIVYGFAGRPHQCGAAVAEDAIRRLRLRNFLPLPVVLGLVTGVNICPPFLTAFGSAVRLPALWQSLLFFTAFFAGTSIYLAPLPLVGLAGRRESVRIVGRFTAGIVGLVYLYCGVVSMIGLR